MPDPSLFEKPSIEETFSESAELEFDGVRTDTRNFDGQVTNARRWDHMLTPAEILRVYQGLDVSGEIIDDDLPY